LRPEESDLPDAALGQGTAAGASELAAAVEMVHAYSLVHDDLPCMDNDDVRRGRPSAHRKFDVPLATAAGVAMVPLAVRICHAAVRSLGLSNEDSAAICAVLLRAAGAGGMIAGQVLDLEGEGRSLQLEQLERVHAAKTGALIAAAARMGAMAAGADNSRVAALGTFGEALGLVFQITDDLLDVTETTATLGKTAGRDVELQKSTYPALLGEESARELAATKADEAVERLRLAGAYTPVLGALASYVVGRRS
jgi:geranylgeranyl pyrophosphate synthase